MRDDLTNWCDGVAAGIDEYIAVHRTVPGFRSLRLDDVVDVHRLGANPNNGVIAEHLARALVERFDIMDTPRLRSALEIAVSASDALIKLAFRRQPDGDERVLAEAKGLASEYLLHHLDAEQPGGMGHHTQARF
jgi:hypothetical protein